MTYLKYADPSVKQFATNTDFLSGQFNRNTISKMGKSTFDKLPQDEKNRALGNLAYVYKYSPEPYSGYAKELFESYIG